MKRILLFTIACAGLALFGAGLSCSNGGENLAGGSGTGNPGGSVVVAVVADTGTNALQKDRAPHGKAGGQNSGGQGQGNGRRSLPIRDEENLGLNVEIANISISRIHFILGESVDCSELLEEFSENRLLKCDSESIVLEGPFVVDLLSGAAVPALDSVLLPEADYRGIRLFVECMGQNSSPACLSESPVQLAGTFEYENKIREFDIRLSVNGVMSYMRTGAPVAIRPGETTAFTITLNADRWLQSLNLRECLEKGDLPLDDNGNLKIVRNSGRGMCNGVESMIGQNVTRSGAMRVERR